MRIHTSDCTAFPNSIVLVQLEEAEGSRVDLEVRLLRMIRNYLLLGPYKLPPPRTLLIRNCFLLGPYSRAMPRTLRWSWGGGQFLMSEVPVQGYLAHKKTYSPRTLP